jgi:hypothetical protein
MMIFLISATFFKWQDIAVLLRLATQKFALSVSLLRHEPLHRKWWVESLGSTSGSSLIGLEALHLLSHWVYYLEGVILLGGHPNMDILV